MRYNNVVVQENPFDRENPECINKGDAHMTLSVEGTAPDLLGKEVHMIRGDLHDPSMV